MKSKPNHIVELPREAEVEDELLCTLDMHTKPVEPLLMYTTLSDHFRLTALQRNAGLPETRENAWQNRVRQARRNLVDKGYVDRFAGHGLWILTETGRAQARERERQKGQTPGDLGL